MRNLDIPWFQEASRRRRYLAGVSGGADSVAMLHLLARAGFQEVVVCHLNHRLRGAESDRDEVWVRDLVARLGYRFECGAAEVRDLMVAESMSLETAARRARHEFFASCGARHRCQRLLLAHHADDQAETVLWNLLRGSRGASGMSEQQALMMSGRKMEVLRPMLAARRRELREWLEAEGLEWREDASNAEPVAARNRLRHEVLPLLEDLARRDVVPALLRAEESARELREIELWAVARAEVLDPQGRLHVPKLRSLPESLQRACVFEYLRRSGVPDLDRAVVARVMGLLEEGAGPAAGLPGGREMRRRGGRLFMTG